MMPDPSRDVRVELRRLVEAITQSLIETSGVELAEQLRREGKEPTKVAESLRSSMLTQFRKHQQSQLKQAKEAYENKSASLHTARNTLPGTPADWRALLDRILHQHAEVGDLVTIQFRDLTKLPDEEIASLLLRLKELGLSEDGEKQV